MATWSRCAICGRAIPVGELCYGVKNWRGDPDGGDTICRDCLVPENAPTLTPPNEPLTIEQLREMDGEPVWFDTIKRWGVVKVCRDGVFVLTKSGEFEVGRCKYYRRPPEGGGNA